MLPPYVPDAWTVKIGAQAIDGILNVLASSMLAVTVFSLSTMVAAYGAATTNVTPRATRLLMEDNTSQNVLGTFIGSFLFSLVGIIALSTGAYGDQGRAILLVVTIGLIVVIAATILRWIDYLARFGRLSETIERVEEATWKAMETRLAHPYLCGRPFGHGEAGVPSQRCLSLPSRSVMCSTSMSRRFRNARRRGTRRFSSRCYEAAAGGTIHRCFDHAPMEPHDDETQNRDCERSQPVSGPAGYGRDVDRGDRDELNRVGSSLALFRVLSASR